MLAYKFICYLANTAKKEKEFYMELKYTFQCKKVWMTCSGFDSAKKHKKNNFDALNHRVSNSVPAELQSLTLV